MQLLLIPSFVLSRQDNGYLQSPRLIADFQGYGKIKENVSEHLGTFSVPEAPRCKLDERVYYLSLVPPTMHLARYGWDVSRHSQVSMVKGKILKS